MIVITGATGNVGRPLVELLLAEGARVLAVTRDPDSAGLPAGVDVATDLSRLTGATTLYLNPRTVGTRAAEVVASAREQGVRRVVVQAAINVGDDLDRQPSRFRGDLNREAEDAAVGSGLEWVSLRPAFFAVNTIGLWSAQLKAGDIVRGPFARATAAPIHERDVAEVAARALLGDLTGTRPALTGPESLTEAGMVATIGAVLGRDLSYVEVPPDVVRQGMVAHGLPAAFADAFLAMQEAAVGQSAQVTDGVRSILGRPAATFAEWVTEHAEVFTAERVVA